MRVLVLCGDLWHPCEVPQKGLLALEKFGFEFDWIENANDWSAAKMAAYPIVILSKSNNVSSADESPWMSESVQQAFLGYVQNGNGLLVLHSGTADYQQAQTLRALMGGVFREHPDQCLVTVTPRAGHPLTAESETFTLVDEHYFMDMDDSQVDIFLTTNSEHGTQPAGWTRTAGFGRVGVLTPGHNLEIWQHPAYQQLIINTLNWLKSN